MSNLTYTVSVCDTNRMYFFRKNMNILYTVKKILFIIHCKEDTCTVKNIIYGKSVVGICMNIFFCSVKSVKY